VPLENYEVFDNVGDLMKGIGSALKKDSDGGKTITTREWVDLGSKFLTDMGVDLVDDDEE